MIQYMRSIIEKNERTKNNNNIHDDNNKCSEIGNNQVLNIEGMQDFNLILPLYSSSSVSVFNIAFKRKI